MKISEETISPKRAQELLDTYWKKDAQRTPAQSVVDGYARAMKAGHWGLTHQGIAISADDELIDGVQRLLAIVQSGVSVRCVVAREVPARTNLGQETIDLIDRGRIRSVGQQLQLRHGYSNGNLIAAASRSILVISGRAVGVLIGPITVGNTLAVLDLFGTQVKYCASNRSGLPGLRNGVVIGSFAFAMRCQPDDVRAAYERFVTGENLTRGNPMLTLRNFLQTRVGVLGGSGTSMDAVRATLQALQKATMQEQLGVVKPQSEIGVRFFADKQKQAINKLLVACGYLEAEKKR
jgi:hypothetical protein